MRKLSLLSASVFSLFLASCGGRGGGRSADTDSDGIFDSKDSCRNSSTGFISTPETDYDGDGCKDSTEDVDDDGDGLIELHNATELNNIRHDLDGTHYDDRTSNEGSNAGCPTTNPVGCIGYELADDIDLATDPATSDWVPIAGNFIATLEGNGHSINNLTIDRDSQFTGLFGVLGSEGTVQNLSFVGGSVVSSYNSSSYESYAGVLVGSSFGTISDVSAGLSIFASAASSVGGLVGYNKGNIQNSSATGNVDGGGGSEEAVGGLVGYNYGIIQGSSATGNVGGGAGDRNSVGGLVGVNTDGGTIQGSFATGKADGDAGDRDVVGGLVGYNFRGGNIEDSYAIGKADGGDGERDRVGGLVGISSIGSLIQNSYATGNANGGKGDDDYVGGLVGRNYESGTIQNSHAIIRNSYATGKADGGDGNEDFVGGLVGSSNRYTIIQNSYAAGNADGGKGDGDRVGGLAGNLDGTIKNSYATGNGNGSNGNGDYVGGLVGYVYFGILQKSYSLSDVDGGAGNDNVGRLVGYNDQGTISSNYYYSGGSLASGDTEERLEGTNEAEGKDLTQLGALDVNTTVKDFGAGNSWSTNNWQFTNTKYPSLKSYKENSSGEQVNGKLLCDQPTDFVQCPTP